MATLLKVLNDLADINSAGGCCTSRQNSGRRALTRGFVGESEDDVGEAFRLARVCWDKS
jgi:hypothetical protein